MKLKKQSGAKFNAACPMTSGGSSLELWRGEGGEGGEGVGFLDVLAFHPPAFF